MAIPEKTPSGLDYAPGWGFVDRPASPLLALAERLRNIAADEADQKRQHPRDSWHAGYLQGRAEGFAQAAAEVEAMLREHGR